MPDLSRLLVSSKERDSLLPDSEKKKKAQRELNQILDENPQVKEFFQLEKRLINSGFALSNGEKTFRLHEEKNELYKQNKDLIKRCKKLKQQLGHKSDFSIDPFHHVKNLAFSFKKGNDRTFRRGAGGRTS